MNQKNTQHAQVLYDLIIQTANKFLHNCKHFPIDILKGEDPSYAQLAVIMRRVATIITLLADSFDPMIGQKAGDYCNLMTNMGIAIDKGDEIELARLVEELKRKPGS